MTLKWERKHFVLFLIFIGYLGGGRRPDQMDPWPEIFGWRLDQTAIHAIDQILQETIKEPVGPEFMAPPSRKH